MDFGEIPDDIWFSIFEQICDPPTLAILVRTCRRFHGLASKLLLRELKWVKPELTLRNIEAWAAIYSTFVALPRKITIGVPFEFAHSTRPQTVAPSPDMKLHDIIYTQLLRFTSVTEICLDGTVVSPYTYSVLGQIPTLRSLRLENCSFANLHGSFSTKANRLLSHPFGSNMHPPQSTQDCPLEIISMVPIKHLSLHRIIVPSEYENYRYHPLSLLTIPTLTSLSITWNTNIAARYALNRWALPSLTELSVVMPLMSRDLLDELATFVHRCESSPRFKLKIDKHNLSDTQMATVQIPSSGLWNYEGPLVVVAGSATKALRPTLTHVKINETLELSPLLDGLEKLPMVIEELEVKVGKWDIELLFAIKELFKKIKRLVVRYVRGDLPENLLVRLGADILFCLPDLVSVKLFGPKPHDAERSLGIIGSHCTSNILPSLGSGAGPPHTGLGHIHPHSPVSVFHNLIQGGLGTTSEYSDSYGLDSNADHSESTGLNEEQFGSGVNVSVIAPPHSTSSHDVPSSALPFQSNRPGLLWRPTSSPRRSSAAFSSTAFSSAEPSAASSSNFWPSVSSGSRRAVFGMQQVRPERRNPKPPDRLETASPLSQAELGDYLIGWSRYCPSLRVVQIDHRWWWERRFTGDQWGLRIYGDDARSNDKGKEREGTAFV